MTKIAQKPTLTPKKIDVWLTDDSEQFCKAVIDGLIDNIYLKLEKYFLSAQTLIHSLEDTSVRPNVILLDVEMPGMDGLETIGWIRRLSPSTRIIMLSCHDDGASIRGSLDEGAIGYLVKPSSCSEIVNAVRASMTDIVPLDKRAASKLLRAGKDGDADKKLTPRERQVLQLIADGLTRKEIADRLSISSDTVHFHFQNIYFKYGVHRRRDLT
jgi:DNA-binding NarL/FixJ family response regulator